MPFSGKKEGWWMEVKLQFDEAQRDYPGYRASPEYSQNKRLGVLEFSLCIN